MTRTPCPRPAADLCSAEAQRGCRPRGVWQRPGAGAEVGGGLRGREAFAPVET